MFYSRFFFVLMAVVCFSGCGGGAGSEDSSGDSAKVLESNSLAQVAGFPNSVDVFGVGIYGTEGVSEEHLLHAAKVMAGYLDNDRDGIPDNQLVIEQLRASGGKMFVFASEEESERYNSVIEQNAFNSTQLFTDEIHIDGAAEGKFDATLEESLHLITAVGYALAYPNALGERPGTDLANAMDAARGGQFETVPTQYPASAWYTYYDQTCEYECQVTEYIYWGLSSVLNGQNFPGREGEISEEWRLNTLEKIKTSDPALYAILTNPNFLFPTTLPDGTYQAATLPLDTSGTATPPEKEQEEFDQEEPEEEQEWDEDQQDWGDDEGEGWDEEEDEEDWGEDEGWNDDSDEDEHDWHDDEEDEDWNDSNEWDWDEDEDGGVEDEGWDLEALY